MTPVQSTGEAAIKAIGLEDQFVVMQSEFVPIFFKLAIYTSGLWEFQDSTLNTNKKDS